MTVDGGAAPAAPPAAAAALLLLTPTAIAWPIEWPTWPTMKSASTGGRSAFPTHRTSLKHPPRSPPLSPLTTDAVGDGGRGSNGSGGRNSTSAAVLPRRGCHPMKTQPQSAAPPGRGRVGGGERSWVKACASCPRRLFRPRKMRWCLAGAPRLHDGWRREGAWETRGTRNDPAAVSERLR